MILIGSAFAADVYIGKEYRWLAFGPPLISFAVRWLVAGHGYVVKGS